jgi:hypothetical protein
VDGMEFGYGGGVIIVFVVGWSPEGSEGSNRILVLCHISFTGLSLLQLNFTTFSKTESKGYLRTIILLITIVLLVVKKRRITT